VSRPNRYDLETLAHSVPEGRDHPSALALTIRPPRPAELAPTRPRLAEISLAFDDPSLAPADFAGQPSHDADLVIAAKLGEGGMSTVYLAYQRTLDREVAIKTVRPTKDYRRREAALVDEAQLTGFLEHPNIVPVHALGRDAEGRPVLVMKRVEGAAWRELIDDPAHPAWSAASVGAQDRLATHLQILMQVANALEFAHSRGVVHRDVKPENVMIGAFGEVYLVDWGVALHLDSPQSSFGLAGTPRYLAPEMVPGGSQVVDARTDVYLLGATLHVVLTGRFRHEGDDLVSVLEKAIDSKPFDYGADVPVELAALCNAATCADRSQRPASAAAFREALASYLNHRSSIAAARAAQASYDELSRRLEANPDLTSVDVAQRLAECRFGFLEALRGWSGNEAARLGLRACQGRMVEREIAQRNAPAARVLLAELEAPEATLVARVEALEEELRAAREREQRSALKAWAMDASVLWVSRVAMLVVFLVGALIANVWEMAQELRTGQPTPIRDVVTTDLLQLAAVAIGLGTAGRRLLAHPYNRRVVGVLVIATLMVTAIDCIAWLRGVGSRTANLIDCAAMVACFAVASLGIEPGWWRIVALWIAATLLAGRIPALANGAASLATLLTVVLGIWVAWRRR
jgi:serine/threonine-protein kinase